MAIVDQLKSKTLLRILHVSDIHYALESISHLREHLQALAEKIDLILLSGDNADMDMDYNASPETIQKYEEDMRRVVQSLEAIHPIVIYIPGNHDPITIFGDHPPEMTLQSINVHKQCIQLASNLRLVGFGGSVPGFQHGKQIWDGFPFPTEEEFSKEFMPFVEQLHDFIGSTIFMTHIGPESLGTAVFRSDISNPIEAGSKTVRETMESEKMQKTVFLHLHGHSHAAIGRIEVGRTTTSNPGPLRDGYFALYTVVQQPSDKMWKLRETTFGQVD